MKRRLYIKIISIFVITIIALFTVNTRVKADDMTCYYSSSNLGSNRYLKVSKSGNSENIQFYSAGKNITSKEVDAGDGYTYSLALQDGILGLNQSQGCPKNIYAIYRYEINTGIYELNCNSISKKYTCYVNYSFSTTDNSTVAQYWKQYKDNTLYKNGLETLSYTSDVSFKKQEHSGGGGSIDDGDYTSKEDATKKESSAESEKEGYKKMNCDSMPTTFGFIRAAYNFLRFIVPVIIVLLSAVDFISVVVSGEAEKMEKAKRKFIIRLIVGIIILFVPIILEMLLKLIGILNSDESLVDIACL